MEFVILERFSKRHFRKWGKSSSANFSRSGKRRHSNSSERSLPSSKLTLSSRFRIRLFSWENQEFKRCPYHNPVYRGRNENKVDLKRAAVPGSCWF
ncbi:hypothetical protein JTE90_006909 [Oedothorax gibbosus]|uniref:Uncharacterized protein n=1 Tax=Oedothorax gibbosus TaxID=931172 RepID=A0AAV6VQ13_9ARAC|nr:hypothetical protein JTE90_006909 [Oedothorax gibbosus]